MFLAGLFITMPYYISYLAFAVTAELDRKSPIVMNRSHHLHLSRRHLGVDAIFYLEPLFFISHKLCISNE